MRKLVFHIIKGAFYASLVPLSILPILTTLDVVGRDAFRKPIDDTVDMSGMLLSMMISLALAYTTYRRGNVAVTYFVDKLSDTFKIILHAVTYLAGMGLFAMLTWQATIKALYSLRVGEFTGARELPLYPVKFLFAFGCLLTFLALASHFFGRSQEKAGYEGMEMP